MNIPEMRLYYYLPSERGSQTTSVVSYPVGLGRQEWRTPKADFRIRGKTKNPVWVLPETVKVERIAEKFIMYYWRQAAPYTHSIGDPSGRVLLQNPKQQAEIVSRLKRVRDRHGDALLPLLQNQRSRELIIRGVAGVVAEMPLGKLQNVGGGMTPRTSASADLARGRQEGGCWHDAETTA